MIPPNELRIGNWVLDSGGKWLRVDYWEYPDKVAMKMFVEGTEVHPMTEDIKNTNPITLTPEVLEKCGFTTVTTNSDGSYNMWGKELDASIDIEEGEVYKYRIHERERTKHIMYLHQLQNLYFALSGEELPVTL